MVSDPGFEGFYWSWLADDGWRKNLLWNMIYTGNISILLPEVKMLMTVYVGHQIQLLHH